MRLVLGAVAALIVALPAYQAQSHTISPTSVISISQNQNGNGDDNAQNDDDWIKRLVGFGALPARHRNPSGELAASGHQSGWASGNQWQTPRGDSDSGTVSQSHDSLVTTNGVHPPSGFEGGASGQGGNPAHGPGPTAGESNVGSQAEALPDPVAIPGPISGAGFPGLVLLLGTLLVWWRTKKNLNHA